MNLTADEQLVVILATAVLGCLWAVAGSWWALGRAGRHARYGAEPVTLDVFRANIRRALMPPVIEVTPRHAAADETTAPFTGPVVPGFARAIPAPVVTALPTDPHGIAIVDLPPLTAGRGPMHGTLPYRGEVPVRRTWACSFCHDGEVRMSKAGECPWCGTKVRHANGAVR